MRIAFALVALTALMGAPLAGQHPQSDSGPHRGMGPGMHDMGPGMQGMHEMMMPMALEMGGAMRVLVFAPDHLLARKDSLGLSAQQVARLTALRDAAREAYLPAITDAGHAFKTVERQFGAATLDTVALKVHFQDAHLATGQAHWIMLSAAAQARAMLTEAQRAKVQAWAESMPMLHPPMPGPH